MFNPCCCPTTCKLGEDAFTRSDSSDINAGAPLAYTVTGTASIASNRLALDASSKVVFSTIGPDPTGFRTYQITFKGDSGSIVRFYCGAHYFEVLISTTGYMALYEADGTLVMLRAKSISAATDRTVTVAYGPLRTSGSSTLYGLMGASIEQATVDLAVFVECSGTEFGVGTGGTATNVSFDALTIWENTTLATGTAPCGDSDNVPCITAAASDIGGSGLTPDWSSLSGSWVRNGTSMRCTSSGKLKYTGLNAGQPVQFSVLSSTSLSSGDSWSVWLLDQDTGVVRYNDGADKVDIYVGGVLQETISTSHNTIELTATTDVFYVCFDGARPNRRWYQWSRPDTIEPVIEDGVAGGGNRDYAFGVLIAFGGSPWQTCPRSTYEQVASGARCTGGAVSDYDIIPDNIAGTCSGGGDPAVNINGVAFRVDGSIANANIAGTLDVCGSETFYAVSYGWLKLDVTNTGLSPFETVDSVRFFVWIQFGNAWALFYEDYDPTPACSVFSMTDIPLVDYFNGDDFDMSSATVSVESIP